MAIVHITSTNVPVVECRLLTNTTGELIKPGRQTCITADEVAIITHAIIELGLIRHIRKGALGDGVTDLDVERHIRAGVGVV